MIFHGKLHFQPGLQSQSPTGNPPSCKSFLGPAELLTTYKAFVHSLMKYCSLLWAGAPASHLSQLLTVETKALKSLVSPSMRLSLCASHSLIAGTSVVFLSLTVPSPVSSPPALCAICPHHVCAGCSTSAIKNYQNQESLLTFTLPFICFSHL